MNAPLPHQNRILSARSLDNLKGVHPDLVKVVRRAHLLCAVDFTVIEGLRTRERQMAIYGQGRTVEEVKRAGLNPSLAKPKLKKVTWTLISNHFPNADGLGEAVDLAHIVGTIVYWEHGHIIAEAMLEAARQEGVAIRWGKDWNRNGKPGEKGETDGPHFELWGARRV